MYNVSMLLVQQCWKTQQSLYNIYDGLPLYLSLDGAVRKARGWSLLLGTSTFPLKY
jgi:hypothetical protein